VPIGRKESYLIHFLDVLLWTEIGVDANMQIANRWEPPLQNQPSNRFRESRYWNRTQLENCHRKIRIKPTLLISVAQFFKPEYLFEQVFKWSNICALSQFL
jgi:hypothetical protein